MVEMAAGVAEAAAASVHLQLPAVLFGARIVANVNSISYAAASAVAAASAAATCVYVFMCKRVYTTSSQRIQSNIRCHKVMSCRPEASGAGAN